MCGIVGLLAFGKADINEKMRQEAMIILSTELLQNTQHRGKDATGLAVLFKDSEYMGLKMGITATEFVSRFGDSETHYNSFVEKWRNRPSTSAMVIGHCRKPSTGGNAGPEDNVNNHPIKVGDTLGVHNGTISNHSEILKQLNAKADGNVDSEAIFRLVNHYNKNGTEPFTNVMIQEICRRITGQYACLTFNSNNPFQMAAFRDGRPMEFALIKPLGLFLIASEKDILRAAVFKYNQMAYLYNTTAKIKLAQLKKGDVELASSEDDSMYIFDIRQEITDDVKIVDLYVNEKIPRTGKIWAATTTTNIHNHNRSVYAGGNYAGVGGAAAGFGQFPNRHSSTFPAAGTSEEDKKNTTNTGSGSVSKDVGANSAVGQRVGMLFNKKTGKYEDVVDQKKAEELGNIVLVAEDDDYKIMDALSGDEVTTIKTPVITEVKKSSVILLPHLQQTESAHLYKGPLFQETDEDLEKLITDPAKIKIVPVKYVSETSKEQRPVNTFEKKGVGNEILVDMEVRPDVIEKALAAYSSSENFKSMDDLAESLGIENPSTMLSMSVYALANRVRRHVFVDAWSKGFLACEKTSNKDRSMPEDISAFFHKAVRKQQKAKGVIKNLKVMTKLFLDISERVPEDVLEHVMHMFAASKTINGIDVESLEHSYSIGELKNPTLKKAMTILKKKLDKGNEKSNHSITV